MENNENQGRPDNWVDAHPDLYPNAVTNVLLDGVKKSFGPKKLEVKHMDFGEDDKDYDNKLQEALGK